MEDGHSTAENFERPPSRADVATITKTHSRGFSPVLHSEDAQREDVKPTHSATDVVIQTSTPVLYTQGLGLFKDYPRRDTEPGVTVKDHKPTWFRETLQKNYPGQKIYQNMYQHAFAKYGHVDSNHRPWQELAVRYWKEDSVDSLPPSPSTKTEESPRSLPNPNSIPLPPSP